MKVNMSLNKETKPNQFPKGRIIKYNIYANICFYSTARCFVLNSFIFRNQSFNFFFFFFFFFLNFWQKFLGIVAFCRDFVSIRVLQTCGFFVKWLVFLLWKYFNKSNLRNYISLIYYLVSFKLNLQIKFGKFHIHYTNEKACY